MFDRLRKLILFAVGFSIPMQGVAVGSGALAATPFKFLVVALLFLAGVEFATRSGARWPDRKTFWVLAFLTSFGVSAAMSTVGGVPWRILLGPGSTMIALSAYYFLLSYAARTRDHLITILWGLVMGGAITLAPAIRAIRSGGGLLVEGEARFQGLAGQSNILGADMGVCFAIAVGLFFTTRTNFRRLLAVGTGGVALVGLAVSLSRSAFLGLGSMGIYWLVRSGRRDTIKYVIPAVLLAMVGLATAPQAVLDRAGTIFDRQKRSEDRSIQSRFVTYAVGVQAVASNPAVGVGAERFRLWAVQNRHGHVHTIHNGYLYIAAEQGLFGLVPFLALLVLTWRDYTLSWKRARANRRLQDPELHELGQLALYLQLCLLSFAIGAMFHQMHKAKALWTVMSLSPLVAGLIRERLIELGSGAAERAPAPDSLFPGPEDDLLGSPAQRY